MNTNLKQAIDQVLIHKVTGNLGSVNMQVTGALLADLRQKELEHLRDVVIAKRLEAANEVHNQGE